MDHERNEVYERIPWETLERPSADRQWLLIAVAAALAVGALAFSFIRGQPVAAPPLQTVPGTLPATAPPPATEMTSPSVAPPPMVVTEEDLFALDIEHLAEVAAAHAEWFAVEYLSVDGSEESRQMLSSLLPAGVPLPEAPEGTQVFVDWAGATSVEESAPLTFIVDVTVRSLVARGEGAFTRQPVSVLRIEVTVGDDGLPRVTLPPRMLDAPTPTQFQTALSQVPDEVRAQVEASYGPVVGGRQHPDGTWLVVAMVKGPDEVTRPVTVALP
jgi:hypothetical protein